MSDQNKDPKEVMEIVELAKKLVGDKFVPRIVEAYEEGNLPFPQAKAMLEKRIAAKNQPQDVTQHQSIKAGDGQVDITQTVAVKANEPAQKSEAIERQTGPGPTPNSPGFGTPRGSSGPGGPLPRADGQRSTTYQSIGAKKVAKKGFDLSKVDFKDKKTWLMIGAPFLVVILIVVAIIVMTNMSAKSAEPTQDFSFTMPTATSALDFSGVQVSTATAVPTKTSVPENVPDSASFLASCPDNKVAVYDRFPDPGLIGAGGVGPRPFKTNDLSPSGIRAGDELTMMIYRIVPVTKLDSIVLVEQSSGVFYAPSSWFPAVEGEKMNCLSASEASQFLKSADTMSPPPLRLVFNWGVWWAPIYAGFVVLTVMGVVFSIYLGGRFVQLVLLGSIFLSVAMLAPGVSQEYKLGLFVFGMISSIGLGSQGGLSAVVSIVDRNKTSTLPKELTNVVDAYKRGGGLVGAIDWSSMGWYAGFNLILMLFNPLLSPLNVVYGTMNATIILGLILVIGFGIEAYRRGGKGDWGSYLIAMTSIGNFFIFKFVPRGDNAYLVYICTLVLSMVTIMAMILLGLSKDREEVNVDRLPDGIFQYAAIGLVCLIVAVFLI